MNEIEKTEPFASYGEYKAAFDAEVQRTELGFVRIGYMLRVAQDTDILKESPHTNMEEFAWAEYRIDKSQASRFININKRFSVGGYSGELQERFQGYGVAKLGEMLSLSDQIIEALPEKLTRTEIQEIKKEVKEEQRISDLEVLMEDRPREAIESTLDCFVRQYIHDHPNVLEGLCGATEGEPEVIMDTLAPAGYAALMARIPGMGKMLLSIIGKTQPMELLNIRTNEKETYTWEDMRGTICRLVTDAEPEENWKKLYGEPYPPAEEEKETQRKQEEARKAEEERKAREAEERKNREKKTREEKGKVAPVQPAPPHPADKPETDTFPMPEPQEQEDPAQMEIENYPGVVPETYITCHNGAEVTEPKSLRDEGAGLAEEVEQWMKTGLMEYAWETERKILRLKAIMEDLLNEKCD